MLSIVATPIGNLQDITLRAVETLRNCTAIACEDTRVTGMLLQHLGIEKKPLVSIHSYASDARTDQLVERLRNGEHIVLVSDAGTPGISDPGYGLVSRVQKEGLPLEVVPGPSAFLAALSASGLPMNQFVYLGFLPLKKGRSTLLRSIADEERTVVFYESVHRIRRALGDLAEALAPQPDRTVVIARELTKMYEQIITTTVEALPGVAQTITEKGEFVIVVGPRNRKD
jgi:16S rRNA (cytidine1402-2'-O)-methyltransferase